jgi:branched-chain amino acid transport system substrate-binding protein
MSTKLALAAALAICAGTASAEPLTVATIEAFSGPNGETGTVWAQGVRYGMQKLNAAGGFNGEPIKLVEYDNQSTPGGASDKLRTAIADGARVIFSSTSSVIVTQISDDVRKYNLRNPGKEIIFITPGGEAYELTGEKCHYFFFRMTSNPYMRIKALTSVMKVQGDLGTKVYSINQNYTYGQDMQKAQAEFVKVNGAGIVEATLHDINKIQDFSPYIAKIKAAGAETALTGNWGNDLVLLMKAAANAGLKVRFGTTNLDNPGVIGSAGEVALGAYHVSPYSPEAGGDAGAAFAEDYRAKMGQYPTFSAVSAFSVQFFGEALKRAQSPDKSIDIKKIALAMEEAKATTPVGEMSVRKEDHQGVIPLAVSMASKEARYKADGTDIGLKLVKVVPGAEAVVGIDPACKLQRTN